MGLGDEIMVTGIAKRLQERNPLRVRVLDPRGKKRWHPLWENNPRLAPPHFKGKVQTLVNGPDHRDYIAGKTKDSWRWKTWICPIGEIYLSEAEESFGQQYPARVLLEPNLKPQASPNKDWGWSRWQQLAETLIERGYPVAQLGSPKARRLPHVEFIETKTFRHACAVLARARLAILPEGALHHAAAALGTATIVLFGGYISPLQTGYPHHVNLFTGGRPCGKRIRCAHCMEAMKRISVSAVLYHADTLLRVISVE
jgi:ADP-heptose:LPS heptosyltransferase